jgi:cytidyltransferase-like protein
MKISIVSGGFDPIHSGHISYLKSAKDISDYLIVALNSDNWLKNKKNKNFLPFEERKIILESLKYVDEVIDFKDDHEGSCIDALEKIKIKFPNDNLIFCNGGDRTNKNIPEMKVTDISFEFGIGGKEKKNSSSSILKQWAYEKEERVWGSFYNLFLDKDIKVKELIILPFQGMSFQRHFYRSEIWFLREGSCLVNYSKTSESEKVEKKLSKEDIFFVRKKEWHQIINPYKKVCKIIEIQYGDKVEESDIERLYYFEGNK